MKKDAAPPAAKREALQELRRDQGHQAEGREIIVNRHAEVARMRHLSSSRRIPEFRST